MGRQRLLLHWVIAGLLVAGLVGGTVWGVSTTVDKAVAADAEREARAWARHLITDMPDLEKVLAGAPPDPEQRAFIDQVSDVGHVFRLKLFDANGALVLISDQMDKLLEPGAMIDHRGNAAKVLQTGLPIVSVESGTDAENRPPVYAEAYIAIPDQDGNRVGVVEVYLDQSAVSELFHSIFRVTAMLLAGTFAVGFVGAYAVLIFKQKQVTQSRERADFLAHYDPVSGVLNRAGFSAESERLLADPGEKAGIATLCIDVDRLKSINEAHGHTCGDAFLRHVGDALSQVVGADGVVARLGGGEFAVMSGRSSRSGADTLAQKIQLAISKPVQFEGRSHKGHVSIGVHFTNVAMAVETRLNKADLALYQAKIDGGACHRMHCEALEHELSEHRRLERVVANGLAENRFSLDYQPLVDRRTGQCSGFEALLRLTDCDGVPIPPSRFIPVAEKSLLIEEIGAWVLETAMRAAMTWPAQLFVSVNLSARQFESGRLVGLVGDLLEKTGLPASRLELEVTESLLIENAEGAGKQLAELRALGVSVAMDDFGTGYSSLGYLWQFGFDRLKIDRSFIAGISADPQKARDIIGTIIALGHRLDMKVTAEGIESPMQAALLSDLDCDVFQGFHYGRPMPQASLADYLAHAATHFSVTPRISAVS